MYQQLLNFVDKAAQPAAVKFKWHFHNKIINNIACHVSDIVSGKQTSSSQKQQSGWMEQEISVGPVL